MSFFPQVYSQISRYPPAKRTQAQWLKLVILVSTEMEIVRIEFQGQHGQEVCKPPSQPAKKLVVVACASHISYARMGNRRTEVQAGPVINNQSEKVWRHAISGKVTDW
jgi:hypothetical protein